MSFIRNGIIVIMNKYVNQYLVPRVVQVQCALVTIIVECLIFTDEI